MRNKSIKHWLILAACCGLAASSIGIGANSAGIFFTPISKTLSDSLGYEIGRGEVALYATIYSLVTGFISPTVSKLMKKYPIKYLMLFGLTITSAGTVLMGYAVNLPTLYLLGAVRGLGVAFFALMPITTIISNWFDEKNGLATGLALSFSGLSGAIFNPVLSGLIPSIGWQKTFIVSAVIMIVLALPGILFVLHLKPSEVGLLPYGGTEPKSDKKKGVGKVNYFSSVFILLCMVVLLHTSITGLAQHFSGFSESLGLGASIGAAMTSAGMVGNIVTKLVIGVLSDKWGPFNAARIMITVNFIALLLLILVPSGLTFVFIAAAFLYGSVYSVGASGFPLIVRDIYGSERYSSAYSVINIMTSIGSASSLTIIGYIYSFTNSFYPAFIAGAVIDVLNFLLIAVIGRKKLKADNL